MAGHSKFANIKHRKGAQDKKRANMFTKAGREIIVAARLGGPDIEFNPRLRTAVAAARAINMPKDKIEYAIKRATNPTDGDNFDEMRYEGYGPGGVAVIVEALTDNRNRSAADLRAIFNKAGGNMGESGSVSFMFDRVGLMVYPADIASADDMFEAALEAGADNCESSDELHEITCEAESFNEVQTALAERFGDAQTARLSWKPQTTTPLDADGAQKILRMIDALEENDDVQHVTANYEISDDVAAELEELGVL